MKAYINNSVLKLRQEKGITQEDLAKAVGVTRQTIYALEQGNYTPSVLLSLRIAEFFKLPVEKIFQLKYDK